jgi:uncharacterized membrane protein
MFVLILGEKMWVISAFWSLVEILSMFLLEAIQKTQIFRASRENKGAKAANVWRCHT